MRSLIVVISDFIGPTDWARPIAALATRHTVMAVEVRDPREQELPAVGRLAMVDPESVPASRSIPPTVACASASSGPRARTPPWLPGCGAAAWST